ncbi:MAG: hypothetical protein IT320_17740 [Anaerolineae bacterium]|nr:hypothetical protein [Anaerolineae bacterium]
MARKVLHRLIFQAKNNFGKERGLPPKLDTSDESKYVAYFENENREQFIFVYEYPARTGLLWSNKISWERPLPVVNGKASNARLGDSEKTWLTACWKAAIAVEQHRDAYRRIVAEKQVVEKPAERLTPPHNEILAQMGRLYDLSAERGLAIDCSRSEFMYGWTGFIELIAELEAKYKTQLEAKKQAE